MLFRVMWILLSSKEGFLMGGKQDHTDVRQNGVGRPAGVQSTVSVVRFRPGE